MNKGVQNRTNNKAKYPKSKILGIVLMSVSLLLILFTTTNFLYFIKSFFLGTFGIVCYPVFAFMFLFGVAYYSGRKFVMSRKYLIYLLAAFLCIMAIFHIMFTRGLDNSTFGKYLADCYNAKFTPGGLILGLFTYPVTSLLNHVAGYVLYAIILSVIIALIIDYLYAYKQYSKLNEINTPYKEPEEDIDNTPIPENNQNIFKPIMQAEQEQETYEEPFQEEEEKPEPKPQELSAKEIARHRLNLDGNKLLEQDSQEEKERPSLYEKKENKNSNFLGRAINENETRPPKITDEKPNDGKDNLRDFLNKTYGYNYSSKPAPANSSNTIINSSNYSSVFGTENKTAEPIKPKIEPTIERNFEAPKQSPIITRVEEKPKFTNFENKTFEPKIETKQFDFNSNFESPKLDKQETKTDNDFVNFDKELDISAPKGLSPLNPDSLKGDDDIIVADKPEITPIKPNFVELDPAAAIAQENMVGDSLQKTVELNVPKIDNGIDVNYVQQFIKGTEKQKPKATRRYSKPSNYVRPPIDLLTVKSVDPAEHSEEETERATALENVLAQFKIDAKVVAIRRGAAVTRFELQIPLGTPVNRIAQYTNDIAMVLKSKGEVRIEAPIRGKNAVGVEIPNDNIDTVGLKDIIESPNFINSTSPLTFGLGKDVDGKVFTCNLQKMPHLLVAGTTGSGKSVCLNAMITSILYKSSPEDVKFILIDPKKVEFSCYNYLPHMLVPTAITEPKKALNAFDWLIQEMENRFLMFQEDSVKNIEEYNDQDKVHNGDVGKLPYIVLIVDEFADLQNSVSKKSDLEDRIKKLAAKSRAAGIHIVIATQRPSVDVITGVIKNNLPSKIAFAVGTSQDSRTILGMGGAEKLLGRGDMLYAPNNAEPTRVQCAFITTQEVNNICEFVRENNSADFDESIEESLDKEEDSNGDYEGGGNPSGSFDPLMKDAVRFFIETQRASSSSLQRKFAIGFNRAARITDEMYKARFIGPSEGSKPGAVYITKEQFSEIFGEEF